MSTFELIAAGIAFILFGIPVCILVAIAAVLMVWHLTIESWKLAFLLSQALHDDICMAWDRRREAAEMKRRDA